MKTYAHINGNLVVEIIPPAVYDQDIFEPSTYQTDTSTGLEIEVKGGLLHSAGAEVPIGDRFHPDFLVNLKEVPEGLNVEPGWTWWREVFSAPVAPVVPPPTVTQCSDALDNTIDLLAQAWGYKNMDRASGYATSSVPKFAAEAKALIDWRDEIWVWAPTYLAAVEAGTTPPPATIAALVALMPAQPTRPVTA